MTEFDSPSDIWGDNVVTSATSQSDGFGNTQTIDAVIDNGAAVFCYNDLNVSFEWYLPAIEELEAIYTILYLQGFGNFSASNYWSSTETGQNTAFILNFQDGIQSNLTPKSLSLNVRCARLIGSA